LINPRYLASLAHWLIAFSLALVAAVSQARPILWQVSDSNSPGKLYLFGSIHFGSERLYPLPEVVAEAFNDSDALAVEIDLSAIDASEAARVLRLNGRLPPGETIGDSLEPQLWVRLQQTSDQLNLPIEALERMQPWLIAVQLTAAQVRRNGFSEGFGIDRHFLTLASHPAAPKPVVELETFSEQTSLFSMLSHDQQLEFLTQTLEELTSSQDMLASIMTAWQVGDERALESLIVDAFEGPGSRDLYQRIFVDRNARMHERLTPYLEQGKTIFVVVGAGHVIGSDGLKQRFLSQGFEVKQVNTGNIFAPEAETGKIIPDNG